MPRNILNQPSPCPSLLGKKLGHHFIQVSDSKTDEEYAVMCSRCGLVVGARRDDGCPPENGVTSAQNEDTP